MTHPTHNQQSWWKQSRNSGIVLISLLVFMTMGIIVAVASATLLINKRQSALQISGSVQALNLAESGIENAMLKLIRNPNYNGEILSFPEGDVIIHVSGSDPYNISAEATVGDFIKTVEAETAFIDGTLQVISYGEIYYDCSPLPWYDEAWEYRIKNLVRGSKVPGSTSLTDFPLLFSFKESLLVGNTQFNGEDIIFVDENNNKLSHELESFDAVTGEIIAWVKMPELKADEDTTVYMYYGNPLVSDQQNVADVWSNGYEAVYHLNDDFLDSTDNNRDGTNNGTVDIKGIAGDGQDWEYYHEYDYIDIGNWNVPGREMTLEAWALYESFGHPWARLISKSNANTYPGVNFMLATWDVGSNVVPRSMFRTTSSQAEIHYPSSGWGIETNKWYLFSSSYDGDVNNNHVRLSLNGDTVLEENQPNVPPRDNYQNNWDIFIGNNPVVFDRNIDGRIDEVRISSVVRSADWMKTQYNNVSLPTSFLKSCGPETELAPPPTPTVTPTLYPTAPAWCGGTTWFHPDWTHRQLIIVQQDQVAGSDDYLDYPLFVSFSDPTMSVTAQSDGDDIRFVDVNGLSLDFELESYDSDSGTVHAWVRLPSLYATADTPLYIYYGNPIAGSESNPDGVWNDDYQAVYHFHTSPVGEPPQILDSTLENSGVSNGLMTSTDVVDGRVGLATDFDGDNDYVQTGGIYGGNQSHAAFSGWARFENYGENHAVFSKVFGHDTYPRMYYQSSTDQLWLQYSVDSASSAIIFNNFSSTVSENEWFHYAVIFDAEADRVRFKINDGELTGSNTHSSMDSFTGGGFLPRIGYDSNQSYRMDGRLDEIRFYSDSVSEDLLTTEFRNQGDPDSFMIVSDPDLRSNICVSPTPEQQPSVTPTPTAPPGAVSSMRVTTYELEAGEFSGDTYTLELNQNLSSQYFVSIAGASNLTSTHGSTYDAVRVSGDPFGHFANATAANELQLTRGNSTAESWEGSISVVECLSDCDNSGFILKEVEVVSLPQSGLDTIQTVTETLNENHSSRTVPFGGIRGGGISTSTANPAEYAPTVATRIRKSGTNQIQISRRSNSSQYAQPADVVVYVVEWGSEWTVQEVTVGGTNAGDGVDAVGEYNQAFISQVQREGSWVWGGGYTTSNTLEGSGLAQALTLGNGVTENGTEELVAVGGEGSLSGAGRTFTVYTMSHPRLVTDQVFISDGNAGDGSFQELSTQIRSPQAAETHQNGSSSVRVTSGYRLPLVYMTSAGSSTNYPRAGGWAGRLTAFDTLSFWRTVSGETAAGWVQVVDFGRVVGQPSALPTATIAPTPTSPPLTTQCIPIATGTNDAEQNLSSGAVTLNSSRIELGYLSSNPQLSGFRFTGVNVLQAAQIYEAKLIFTASTNYSTATNLTFSAEDVANSAVFSSSTNNLSARPKTSATQAWSAVPNWSSGVQYESPNLAAVVQEVVNRGDWQPGNSMSLLVEGTGVRGADSFEDDPNTAAELCISAITGTGNQPTVTPTPSNTPTPSPTPAPECVVYNSSDIPKNLPNGTSSVTSTLNVGDAGTITDVDLIVNMTHSWVGDIGMTLTNVGTGTSITAVDRPGVPGSTYGCSLNDIVTTLDDSASSLVENACPPTGASYRPNYALSTFNGQQSSGQWRLQVNDYYTSGDSGVLNSWALRICRTPQPTATPTATPVPTNTPTATPTPTPLPNDPSFRVSTYELENAEFSGTTYTLDLENNLASDYFVLINGVSDREGSRGPNEDGVRVSGDPFSNFSTTTAADDIQLSRDTASFDWTGAVTVVECLADCSASGFQLREVVQTNLSQGAGNTLQTATATLSQNYTSRTSAFGGMYGGGISTSTSVQDEWGVTLGTKIDKINGNQLRFQRYGGQGRVPAAATIVTYVVEWGSEWTVQTANVTGTNSGSGIDSASEYNSASISTVNRDQTWIWGSGFTYDDGLGDGAFGQVMTLGDGVTQNSTESQVSVGGEVGLISPGRDFSIFVLSHPDLNTDQVFKPLGDSGDGGYQQLTAAVTGALGPESYDNSSSSVRHTVGSRLALIHATSTGSGQNYPRSGGWAFRHTGNTQLTYWRPYSNQNFSAWIQSVDFAAIAN